VSFTDDEHAERSCTLPALLPEAFGPGSVAGSR